MKYQRVLFKLRHLFSSKPRLVLVVYYFEWQREKLLLFTRFNFNKLKREVDGFLIVRKKSAVFAVAFITKKRLG